MVEVTNTGAPEEHIRAKIKKINQNIQAKRLKRAQKILQETFGKITFDSTKSPLEIQKEMRNDWN